MDVSNIALVKFFLSSNVGRGGGGKVWLILRVCFLIVCAIISYGAQPRAAARPFSANAVGIPARNSARRIIALDILVRGN